MGLNAVVKGEHGKWTIGSSRILDPDSYTYTIIGYANFVSDQDGQQHSCLFYDDGIVIPRMNLFFPHPLRLHSETVSPAGSTHGTIRSDTTINGKPVPVEWLTWTTRLDRLRLRYEGARTLMRAIMDQQAEAFRVELADNPELSRDYSTKDLAGALAENGMLCFK